jgi:hypothetical protein
MVTGHKSIDDVFYLQQQICTFCHCFLLFLQTLRNGKRIGGRVAKVEWGKSENMLVKKTINKVFVLDQFNCFALHVPVATCLHCLWIGSML